MPGIGQHSGGAPPLGGRGTSTYRFGPFLLDEARCELLAGDVVVPLQPQPFRLLTYLLRNRKRVVPKEELLRVVWPDAIVSDAAFASALNAVRRALGDDGVRQEMVATMRRRGVRLVAAVDERSIEAPTSDAAALLDAVGLGLPKEPSLSEGPSLVVLPFDNLTSDPARDYLADGMVEELTTRLAQLPHVLVISRRSAFAYRGHGVGSREIGRRLGVRYLVEGSVRATNDRLRVTIQLADAVRGVHLWAEFYDGDMGDLIDLQSRIAEDVLKAIGIEIREAELARIRRCGTSNVTAYDLLLRGWQHFNAYTRSDNLEARALFQRASEADDRFAQAHALFGATMTTEYAYGWNRDGALLDQGWAASSHAVALDATVAEGHVVQAGVLVQRGRAAEAAEAARRAIELNPNLDPAHAMLGAALGAAGDPLGAARSLAHACRLNPEPMSPHWIGIALLHYQAGREEEAVTLFEDARASNPDFILPRAALALHAHRGGDEAQAARMTQEVLAVNEDLTAADVAALFDPGRGATFDEIRASFEQVGLP